VSWKDAGGSRDLKKLYGVSTIKVAGMYTTNITESVNSKFRKATAGRRSFPTDEALLKCLYMAALELEKKWIRPIKDWASVYAR